MPVPKVNAKIDVNKVWEGNVIEPGGTILSDGHWGVEATAIADKKRRTSLAKPTEERTFPAAEAKARVWDKIVANATKPLQEVGALDIKGVDVALYTLPGDTLVPLSAARVRFIQSITGATELRGADPGPESHFGQDGATGRSVLQGRRAGGHPDCPTATRRISTWRSRARRWAWRRRRKTPAPEAEEPETPAAETKPEYRIGDTVRYDGKEYEVGWVTDGGVLRLQDPETHERVHNFVTASSVELVRKAGDNAEIPHFESPEPGEETDIAAAAGLDADDLINELAAELQAQSIPRRQSRNRAPKVRA